MKRTMKRVAWGWVPACVAVSFAATAGPINFGFETGDFTGWDAIAGDGWATVDRPMPDVHWDMAPALYAYGGYSGWGFATLYPGSPGVTTSLSQTFALARGQQIAGMAWFCMQPYYPAGVGAFVRIDGPDGQRTVLWEVSETEWNWGGWEQFDFKDALWWGHGWDDWNFTAPVGGSYTLSYGTYRTGDSPTMAVFDGASVGAPPVPDRTSTVLPFFLTLVPLAAWARNRG